MQSREWILGPSGSLDGLGEQYPVHESHGVHSNREFRTRKLDPF